MSVLIKPFAESHYVRSSKLFLPLKGENFSSPSTSFQVLPLQEEEMCSDWSDMGIPRAVFSYRGNMMRCHQGKGWSVPGAGTASTSWGAQLDAVLRTASLLQALEASCSLRFIPGPVQERHPPPHRPYGSLYWTISQTRARQHWLHRAGRWGETWPFLLSFFFLLFWHWCACFMLDCA